MSVVVPELLCINNDHLTNRIDIWNKIHEDSGMSYDYILLSSKWAYGNWGIICNRWKLTQNFDHISQGVKVVDTPYRTFDDIMNIEEEVVLYQENLSSCQKGTSWGVGCWLSASIEHFFYVFSLNCEINFWIILLQCPASKNKSIQDIKHPPLYWFCISHIFWGKRNKIDESMSLPRSSSFFNEVPSKAGILRECQRKRFRFFRWVIFASFEGYV